jgi:hypothetical protein
MHLKIIRKFTVTQIIGILPIIVYLLILASKIWSLDYIPFHRILFLGISLTQTPFPQIFPQILIKKTFIQ